jgi:hypothetical protein
MRFRMLDRAALIGPRSRCSTGCSLLSVGAGPPTASKVEGARRSANTGLLLILTALGALLQGGCASARVADGPSLQLHQGFRGTKFTYNNPAQHSVYHWFSLDTAFVTVLARQPGALEEARKATPFRTATIAAEVATFLFMTKAMVTAFRSADDITMQDVESANSDIAYAVGFATASSVFNILGQGYLRRAASMFNVGEANYSVQQGEHRGLLEQSVRNLSLSPTFQPGDGVRFVAGTRLDLRR